MKAFRRRLFWSATAALLLSGIGTLRATAAEDRRGSQLFYRMVGAETNAPILPKTRSVWTQDKQEKIGTTGMSDLGFTEYPFCYGKMDFTFIENYAIYPRLVSSAQADEKIVNSADMVVDHPYTPAAWVLGWEGNEFVQTFRATQPELVRISIKTACRTGTFHAALLEDGPNGKQVGPVKTFESQSSDAGGWAGSTEWGTVRWEPGQAPLAPGRTYGIKLWREDGKPARPYLHATGNAYDDGMLYVDGEPRPESDLGMYIVQEPSDLRRALIPDADDEGWVKNVKRITFVPQTPNVRMITLKVTPVTMDPPTEHGCCDLVIRVRDQSGKALAGPKRGLACGKQGQERMGTVLYAADELKVTPGEKYTIEAFPIVHQDKEIPAENPGQIIARDMNARVYGEPQPGEMPAIFNLKANVQGESRLVLTWSENFPHRNVVEIRGDGIDGIKKIEVDEKGKDALIPSLWRGHTYDYKITSTGPTGLVWRTPTYRVTLPRPGEIEAYTSAPGTPDCFVPLAPPMQLMNAPNYEPLHYVSEVALNNGDFEEQLTGWTVSPQGSVDTPDVGWTGKSEVKKLGMGTRWGDRMAGITHIPTGNRDKAMAESVLSQKVATTPGHAYILSAWVFTDTVKGPPGNITVRLLADPDGDSEFRQHDASQQYWTDGRWMRFEHRFVAAGDKSTIGFEFLRLWDVDRSSAYVDHVSLYDVGPVAGDSGIRLELTDAKSEADDKVEAFLRAPTGYVITGIGSRAHEDNITTMWLRVAPLRADGTLGPSEEFRAGYMPDAGLEAKVALPEGYVATGFGAGIAPEWDVKRFGVWARPLNRDGTLGEEKLFRDGKDLTSGFERQVRVAEGRVLTGAGLNCSFNDVNGIRAESMRLSRVALPGTGRQQASR